MKLYEYEAKEILLKAGVPIPEGETASTGIRARQIAARIGKSVALKAQIMVAGRGKAGGIKFAASPDEAEEIAKGLLFSKIKDTVVPTILVEEKIPIKKELYFGATIDRLNRCFAIMSSNVGGVDIEDAAEKDPKKIFTFRIDPSFGFRSFHARQIAKNLGYSGDHMLKLAQIFEKIVQISINYDIELIEINPLVEATDGTFLAVDSRIIMDDNSLFRQLDYRKKRFEEPRELGSQEFEGLKNGLVYVDLEGNIGIIGNGAGLVMATLDLINIYGGKPANFMDIGGGATPERIETGLKILLSNPRVKVVLVNIFGGIIRCEEVAQGIIKVLDQRQDLKKIVVRLIGTNEAEGKRILANTGVQVFNSMEKAAQKVVELS